MSAVRCLVPDWPARGVRAAFTLRHGGVSRGPFASLNLAAHVGDDSAAVLENRQRLRAALALPSEPLWLSQVHGTTVWDADGVPSPPPTPPVADAAVARRPDTVLAVLVADCLPVLFARRDGGAIAVAHAGWRGLAAGVLEATVAALGGGEPLLAWVGPGIGPRHFEVGEDVRAAFADEAADAFTRNARGRWQCDLARLARARLAAAGVHAIYAEERCTFTEAEALYSFRRDGQTGRMAALIWRPRDAESAV